MDRARSKIGRISQFGLLELTRQRLGPGDRSQGVHDLPALPRNGSDADHRIARRRDPAAPGLGDDAQGLRRRRGEGAPEVIGYLKRSCSDLLKAFEYRFEKQIHLVDSPEQHEDSVLRYLRADGREVRPGGRRKR
jgi:hypothetical protein